MNSEQQHKEYIIRAMNNPDGIVTIIENFDNGDDTVDDVIARNEFYKLEAYIAESGYSLGDILFNDGGK